MTDAEIIAAIRAEHEPWDIDVWEASPVLRVRWDRASVDPGGTVFGPGPYLHVPVEGEDDEWSVRVYPPESLRRRLAQEPT